MIEELTRQYRHVLEPLQAAGVPARVEYMAGGIYQIVAWWGGPEQALPGNRELMIKPVFADEAMEINNGHPADITGYHVMVYTEGSFDFDLYISPMDRSIEPLAAACLNWVRTMRGDRATDVDRMQDAVTAGLGMFWAEVNRRYPEVTTGDVDPMEQMKFEDAVRRMVQLWLHDNHPDNQKDTDDE